MALAMYICADVHMHPSIVHESTMHVRRSQKVYSYAYAQVCTHEYLAPCTRTLCLRGGSRDGYSRAHVQTRTCIHSTVHKSTMRMRRSQNGYSYVYVQTRHAYIALCTRALCIRGEAEGGVEKHLSCVGPLPVHWQTPLASPPRM